MVAVNRYGEGFNEEEEVLLVASPILYPTMIGEILIIRKIVESETGESGFLLSMEHKETGKLFTRPIDVNWLQKIKQ